MYYTTRIINLKYFKYYLVLLNSAVLEIRYYFCAELELVYPSLIITDY